MDSPKPSNNDVHRDHPAAYVTVAALTEMVENTAKCPVCWELKLNTAVFECAHSFCEDCTMRTINHHRLTECFKCRKRLTKPPVFGCAPVDELISALFMPIVQADGSTVLMKKTAQQIAALNKMAEEIRSVHKEIEIEHLKVCRRENWCKKFHIKEMSMAEQILGAGRRQMWPFP